MQVDVIYVFSKCQGARSVRSQVSWIGILGFLGSLVRSSAGIWQVQVPLIARFPFVGLPPIGSLYSTWLGILSPYAAAPLSTWLSLFFTPRLL